MPPAWGQGGSGYGHGPTPRGRTEVGDVACPGASCGNVMTAVLGRTAGNGHRACILLLRSTYRAPRVRDPVTPNACLSPVKAAVPGAETFAVERARGRDPTLEKPPRGLSKFTAKGALLQEPRDGRQAHCSSGSEGDQVLGFDFGEALLVEDDLRARGGARRKVAPSV